jgi:hypothetical protein
MPWWYKGRIEIQLYSFLNLCTRKRVDSQRQTPGTLPWKRDPVPILHEAAYMDFWSCGPLLWQTGRPSNKLFGIMCGELWTTGTQWRWLCHNSGCRLTDYHCVLPGSMKCSRWRICEGQTIADTEPHKLLISAAVATLEVLTAVLLEILILLDISYVEVCLQLQGTLVRKRLRRNSSAFFPMRPFRRHCRYYICSVENSLFFACLVLKIEALRYFETSTST